MKKQLDISLVDQMQLWFNADNPSERFIDLLLTFDRSLGPAEKNDILAFIMNGLKELEVTNKYVIYSLDFAKDDFLQLTFQHLELDRTYALGYLLSQLQKETPLSPPKSTNNL